MTIFVRSSLILVLMIGLTVGLFYAQPAWVAELGLDFWTIPEMEKKLAKEIERRDELDIQQQRLAEAIDRKKEIIEDLISAKISLYQAAAEIQQLTPAEHIQMAVKELELDLKEKTTEEQLFLVVISWAQKHLDGDPEKTSSLQVRLEKEMQQHFLQ